MFAQHNTKPNHILQLNYIKNQPTTSFRLAIWYIFTW